MLPPFSSVGFPRKVPILRLKKKGDDVNVVFEKQVSALYGVGCECEHGMVVWWCYCKWRGSVTHCATYAA